MTAEEQVQSVIDELKAGRKGAWIFDENSNVKADVYTFDAVKILEALKDSGDVIEQGFYDSENFRDNAERMDNTYNYNCNISNDMDWCEGVNDDGERIAMLKFHIAGDVRGNYTDDIVVDIDGCGSLLEYLYDRLNLPECRSLGDCTIDIDPFSEGVNILTEDGREFKCYDIEEKDIVAKIEEETGAKMKAFNKSDVKDDKPKTNTITKE